MSHYLSSVKKEPDNVSHLGLNQLTTLSGVQTNRVLTVGRQNIIWFFELDFTSAGCSSKQTTFDSQLWGYCADHKL